MPHFQLKIDVLMPIDIAKRVISELEASALAAETAASKYRNLVHRHPDAHGNLSLKPGKLWWCNVNLPSVGCTGRTIPISRQAIKNGNGWRGVTKQHNRLAALLSISNTLH
jgi:hypothetical protein